jgi:uncharacterized membrane protein
MTDTAGTDGTGVTSNGTTPAEPDHMLNPRSTAKIGDHPIHPMLIPFPIVFFVSTFVADVVYLTSDDAGWARASVWLLGAGLATALLAALAGFVDFFGDRRIQRIGDAWQHMIGNLAAVGLQAVNFYLRCGEPTTVIAPSGVILSTVVVVLLLFNGWKGWNLVYRHHVGVKDTTPQQDRARPSM